MPFKFQYLRTVMSVQSVVEGVFAVNKPPSLSSAQALRDLQVQFNESSLFAPWLSAQREKRAAEPQRGRRRRREKRIQVKLGHGGTLDPMATGVLIVGVGAGTKSLQDFLSCRKTYDTVVLFGATSESYDAWGKLVAVQKDRSKLKELTRDKVESALEKFRGKIMQKPPIFSALRIDGKRLYEYAREGKELPREIEERPVEVYDLEMLEWYEGGTHPWKYPDEVAADEERTLAGKVMGVSEEDKNAALGSSSKRRRVEEDAVSKAVGDSGSTKKQKTEKTEEQFASTNPEPESEQSPPVVAGDSPLASTEPQASGALKSDVINSVDNPTEQPVSTPSASSMGSFAPAARVRVTSSSGFYVRSLCHDLGKAVGSYGLMTELVRKKQADFELGKNVIEFEDFNKGEEVWGSKVREQLGQWMNAREEKKRKEEERRASIPP
ncbi:pseudouridine synthase [Lineolata rhizophorae]|uniref:tRNA pseudouridine(55) synthase n=1 Tax=Lineolata rhizophorae TaxID=578093 RepID=A0A6A6NNH4_9PEZI|nr:pseudouridine synthase [Lineolata rhizophorae]